MNCKEAKILLTPALDNELPTTDSARLADHVAQCNGCRLEWNAALKLREGMKSISARSSAKPSLEADTIKALRSTYTRKDSFSNRQLPMLAAAVVLLMFFIGWMTLSPSSQPGVSVVALVRSTSHGGDDNGSDFKVEHLSEQSLAEVNSKNGTHFLNSSLNDFRFTSADMVTSKGGQRMLRICYTSDSRDVCIDCYQSHSGMLSFAGESVSLAGGKTARVGSIGSQQIVMISKNGMDMIFASRLPRSELIALVAKNV